MMTLHNYKRISVPVLALYLFVVSIAVVFAVTETEKALQKYQSSSKEDDKIEQLRLYSNLIIDERLGAINSFSSQVSPDFRILDIDKTIINTLLDETKSTLIGYQSKTSTATLEELRSLVDDVYTNTRVYQVVMPKAYGWRTVARSDFILRENVTNYIDDINAAIKYQKSQGENTEKLEDSMVHVKEVSDEIQYRIRIVKDSLDEMQPGRNMSEERQLLEGAKGEMTKIKELLEDVQFEMRQVVKMLEPYY